MAPQCSSIALPSRAPGPWVGSMPCRPLTWSGRSRLASVQTPIVACCKLRPHGHQSGAAPPSAAAVCRSIAAPPAAFRARRTVVRCADEPPSVASGSAEASGRGGDRAARVD
eukprot:2197354-Alexandrium_andersonii.AAC.1